MILSLLVAPSIECLQNSPAAKLASIAKWWQKDRYVRDTGEKEHEFQANVHPGKTKIADLFKKGAKILGLDDPKQFYPHSLRAMFITLLANDPSMNPQEIMQSARHASFSSSASYVVSDGQSKSNKFRALGMNLNSNKRRKVDDNAEDGKL